MEALRCSLVVVAGLIPGEDPDPQYTRRWRLTDAAWQSPPAYLDAQGAALNYAASLMNPQRVNWVRLEWIWC